MSGDVFSSAEQLCVFRNWSGEVSNFPRDVAEMALAHVIENKVEAAYRRGDLFAKRRKMMQHNRISKE